MTAIKAANSRKITLTEEKQHVVSQRSQCEAELKKLESSMSEKAEAKSMFKAEVEQVERASQQLMRTVGIIRKLLK